MKKGTLKEGHGDIERKITFLLFDRNDNFLGETDPMDVEAAEQFYDVDDVKESEIFKTFIEKKKLQPNDVVKAKRERVYIYDGRELEHEYYAPSDSMELFDEKTNTWLNWSGQQLRDPDEYNKNSEGYTPFGDEGDD